MSVGMIIDGKYVRFATLGGGGGETKVVPVGNVKDLSIEESSDSLTLKWKDPDNVIFNGEPIAEWAGTKVVRKEGGNPESVDDGTLVVDSTVKDQYAVDGLQDSDVVADTQYNYAMFPYTTKNVYTMSDLNRASGNLVSYDKVLENNTWAQIDEASRAGVAREIWSLGDTKDGYTIIGFDHDDLTDGNGKAGITFIVSDKLKMSASAWNTYSRPTVFYDASTANTRLQQYLTNGNYGLSDIKPYIKDVLKKYKTSITDEISYAEMSCKLFLPSYSELLGDTQSGWNDEGSMYEGIENLREVEYNYWTRSRLHVVYTSKSWCYIGGGLSAIDMTGIHNLRYCFCI